MELNQYVSSMEDRLITCLQENLRIPSVQGEATDFAPYGEDVIAYLLDLSGRDENIVMVGDTKFDVIGAKAHGISTIGVSWGYGTVEDMVSAGAAAIAYTMEELYQLLST